MDVTSSSRVASAYELKTVIVLALGFGLVGIDRFLISTLFPTIARDLHLGYGDIGTITGALAYLVPIVHDRDAAPLQPFAYLPAGRRGLRAGPFGR